MDAIVYTSESGFTAQYAKLLGEAAGLPVYTLREAAALPAHSSVVYLGWLMAGAVKGCKKAQRRLCVKAICAVGMGAPGSQTPESIAQQNHLAAQCNVFYLQGGYAPERLHGIYKFMMQTLAKSVSEKLAKKTQRTPEENDMLDMMQHGRDCVKKENLSPVLQWLEEAAHA